MSKKNKTKQKKKQKEKREKKRKTRRPRSGLKVVRAFTNPKKLTKSKFAKIPNSPVQLGGWWKPISNF